MEQNIRDDTWFKMRRWSMILIILFSLIGCAASAARTLPDQLALVQDREKRGILQEKLAQASLATLQDYKDYKVGPEDLLEVSFFGLDELGREVRVNGRGEISLPLVGVVRVAGKSPSEIETRLAEAYGEGKFLKKPQITVQVKEYRHQRVMVTGAVVQPGSYEMIGPRTLLEVLGKAGGLNDKAGDKVHIIRYQSAPDLKKGAPLATAASFSPGTETLVVDLRRLLMDGVVTLNYPIQNGDVIHVPPARSAFVLGAVKKPGQVPVKDNLTVSQAIALCEGQEINLASDNVSILRVDGQGQRTTIPLNLKEVALGKVPDPLLKENDVVFVSESSIKRFLYNFRNLTPGSFSLSPAVF